MNDKCTTRNRGIMLWFNQRCFMPIPQKVRLKSDSLLRLLSWWLLLTSSVVLCNKYPNRPPRFLIDGHSEIVLRLKEGPDTPVGSLIYRLRGSDPDNDPLVFGIRDTGYGSDVLRIENLGNNEANLYLAQELDREVRFIESLHGLPIWQNNSIFVFSQLSSSDQGRVFDYSDADRQSAGRWKFRDAKPAPAGRGRQRQSADFQALSKCPGDSRAQSSGHCDDCGGNRFRRRSVRTSGLSSSGAAR